MTQNSVQEEFNFPISVSDDDSGKVVMRHDFEEMTYSLSNMGQKILFEVLSKLNSYETSDNQVVKLTAAELDQFGTGFSKTHVYKTFSEACKEVQALQIFFRTSDADYEYIGQMPLFRASLTKFVVRTKKLSEAYFALSPDAAPYLTSITKEMRFTTVLSEQLRLLKYSHSGRLYLWLRKNHWITIERPSSSAVIDTHELMMKLDFSRSTSGWGDFKRRILDPAVEEVNDVSDIRCEYQVIERGKAGKISRLEFTIRNADFFEPLSDQEAEALLGLDIPKREASIGLSTMVRTLIPDISDNELLIMEMTYGADIVSQSLVDLAGAVATNTIKTTPIQFLKGILKNRLKEKVEPMLRARTTKEKLTDRSWAEGLNLGDKHDD